MEMGGEIFRNLQLGPPYCLVPRSNILHKDYNS